ncbi:MAG TPA: MFS transporter [Chitinophagaceae bacterium]|nr:MFS transporter [Chitinophagaceae bacterium]
MQKAPAYILPLIILSQFAGTSLWFVGNAILPDIQHEMNIESDAMGNITAVVQFGFIAGTLLFAIFSVADRFASSKVFFISSLIAALANISIIWLAKSMTTLFVLRFITGFFLAGIYPVGMKIAADWYEKGLGKALGYLVGALVLGTAFPYLLKSDLYALPWKQILISTSAFALIGGLLILLFVGDGPYRKPGSHFQPSAIFQIFRSADFRAAAFGYFGHMWELYTFWAFVPIILQFYTSNNHRIINIPFWSFIIIAIGSLSCVAGGYISQKKGSGRVAFYALLCSGLCCLASFSFFQLSLPLFISLMLIWGVSVIADSPQFSTLVAQTAIPEYKGTALTIVTSIGFAITIASVQFITHVFSTWAKTNTVFTLLAPGPIIGLLFLFRLIKQKK